MVVTDWEVNRMNVDLNEDDTGHALIYVVWSWESGARDRMTLHGFFTNVSLAKRAAKGARMSWSGRNIRTNIETRQLDHMFCQDFKI